MLLGQVLEVSLGEWDLRSEDELVSCISALFTCARSARVDCRKVVPNTIVETVCRPNPTPALQKLTLPLDLNLITELTGLSLYLDSVVEELLECRRVKDIVGSWDRVVDVELVDWLGSGFGGGLLGL